MFHAQLHQRLVALGPPVMPIRPVQAAPSRQRGMRRWTMPAAAAAAVAALAIGLSTLPKVPVPGVASNKPADQHQLADATPTAPVQNNNLSGGQATGTQSGQSSQGTDSTKGPSTPSGGAQGKSSDPTATPVNPITTTPVTPGTSGSTGGSGTYTATVPTQPEKGTVAVTLPERKVVSATVTVAGMPADKLAAAMSDLQARLPGSRSADGNVVQLTLPKDQVLAKAEEVAALYQGAVVKDASQDYAVDYQRAVDAFNKAQQAYQQLQDSPPASGDLTTYKATLAAKQQEMQDAQASKENLDRLLAMGTLRIEFQTSAR